MKGMSIGNGGGGSRNLPKQVIDEINRIAGKNGGLLRPEHVLEQATPGDSPLHEYFTWDDGEAAEAYRLLEARSLIVQVKVTLVEREDVVMTRGYVSLATDRISGGGYRQTTEVLKNPTLREELLRSAVSQLQQIQKRYRHLEELCEVFAALDKIAG